MLRKWHFNCETLVNKQTVPFFFKCILKCKCWSKPYTISYISLLRSVSKTHSTLDYKLQVNINHIKKICSERIGIYDLLSATHFLHLLSKMHLQHRRCNEVRHYPKPTSRNAQWYDDSNKYTTLICIDDNFRL